MGRHHVISGIDRLASVSQTFRGKRLGLMTNPTGVSHDLRSSIDLVREMGCLSALFAVEHGIRGDAQAGDAVSTYTDRQTGLTVYSAYGENSHFTQEMLDAFDVLVFDIQDVGARFYTYLYSLAYAMEACSRSGKAMVVLDRINPIGGERVSGLRIEKGFSSFVGDYGLTTQYALTIGEYARYVRDYLQLSLPLTVVELEGWERWMCLDDTDLPWVLTSPNCPGLETALCYTGTCLFEGTNISEGRGTTIPFQAIGAPFIDSDRLAGKLSERRIPGIHYRPMSFCPTFSKHQGKVCHGVQMHMVDRSRANAFAGGLYLLDTIRSMYPEEMVFLLPEGGGRPMFDLLLGTDAYRTGRMTLKDILEKAEEDSEEFRKATSAYRRYPSGG